MKESISVLIVRDGGAIGKSQITLDHHIADVRRKITRNRGGDAVHRSDPFCRDPNRLEYLWKVFDHYLAYSVHGNWFWWIAPMGARSPAGHVSAAPKRNSGEEKRTKLFDTLLCYSTIWPKGFFFTCEMMSPRAVRTWYKYLYFLWRASSRVSRGREFDRFVRCAWRRDRGRLRWFTRHAVMKHCTRMLKIIATGQMHMSSPPQHGGGSGFGFIASICVRMR